MIFESVDEAQRKKMKLESGELESEDDIWAKSDDELDTHITNDDEFYGERPNVTESKDISALRRIHAKQGYLDGLSSKKEETLQAGFDDGYPLGANIGIEIGKILGILLSLSSLQNETGVQAKELLKEAKDDLFIRKILSNRYFDDDLKLENGKHLVIEEWKEKLKLLNNF